MDCWSYPQFTPPRPGKPTPCANHNSCNDHQENVEPVRHRDNSQDRHCNCSKDAGKCRETPSGYEHHSTPARQCKGVVVERGDGRVREADAKTWHQQGRDDQSAQHCKDRSLNMVAHCSVPPDDGWRLIPSRGHNHRSVPSRRQMPSLSPQEVAKTYRRYAPLYDRLFGQVLEPGRRALTEEVKGLAPASVLEVGVGTGLTLAGYPPSSQLVGIDLSPEMLAHAHERARAMPERRIVLQSMNAECMDFPDDSFDCVTLPYVLSVTPNPNQLVKELRRVCKKDGTILILNHFSGSRFWWLLERAVKAVADKVGFRSDFSFEEHILAHDWQVMSVRAVNLLGLSKLVVIRNT
ncbi:hypothetical protein C1704_07130 [Caldimonas caldifontis]|uniref:Methyltransferase type 11 domain-containing protein n=2 Tax=Caldimonas caldifontis TaxID=1452508 RepID=A0A2S5SVS7_9BURK|nr:hypothetical protein C1704_07130 [Caldimonas caldifontis]